MILVYNIIKNYIQKFKQWHILLFGAKLNVF